MSLRVRVGLVVRVVQRHNLCGMSAVSIVQKTEGVVSFVSCILSCLVAQQTGKGVSKPCVWKYS